MPEDPFQYGLVLPASVASTELRVAVRDEVSVASSLRHDYMANVSGWGLSIVSFSLSSDSLTSSSALGAVETVTPPRHLPVWRAPVPSDLLRLAAVAKSGGRRCRPEPIAPPPRPPSAATPDRGGRSAIPPRGVVPRR